MGDLVIAVDQLTVSNEQETLNARSEYTTSQDDGTAEHRINQYLIKQEIGRGSFGSVHLAADQYGNEYVRAIRKPTYRVGCLTDRYSESGRQRVLKVTA